MSKIDARIIASKMLEVRGLEKQIKTYYEGVSKYVYDWDSCVHPSFSHCGYGDHNTEQAGGGTQTGRLSCTRPNLQNVPRDGKIKDHFTSRFGQDGRIVCCDFSQIEVVAFAYLTQDIQLINDIEEGKDIHCVLGSDLYGEEITKKDPRRQAIKPCTFLVIYGGSYKKLAKEQGLDEQFCKNFVETFYRRYPQAKEWQDLQVKKVEGTRKFIDEYTPKGFQKEEGYLRNVTGRKLYFKTSDAPSFLTEKGIFTGFNPAEIKNYPVQSLATADIALMLHGLLWREAIKHRDKFVLINQIHDDAVSDVRKEYVKGYCKLARRVLLSIQEPMKKYFNLDWDLPLSCEFKVGKTWGEVEKYEV